LLIRDKLSDAPGFIGVDNGDGVRRLSPNVVSLIERVYFVHAPHFREWSHQLLLGHYRNGLFPEISIVIGWELLILIDLGSGVSLHLDGCHIDIHSAGLVSNGLLLQFGRALEVLAQSGHEGGVDAEIIGEHCLLGHPQLDIVFLVPIAHTVLVLHLLHFRRLHLRLVELIEVPHVFEVTALWLEHPLGSLVHPTVEDLRGHIAIVLSILCQTAFERFDRTRFDYIVHKWEIA
jgi:hypothetical protein